MVTVQQRLLTGLAWEQVGRAAMLLLFASDVSDPQDAMNMILAVTPADVDGFEGMYEDVRTLAKIAAQTQADGDQYDVPNGVVERWT